MSKFDELVCKKIADYLDKSMFQIVLHDGSYDFSQIVMAESISEAFNMWKNYVSMIDRSDEDKKVHLYDLIDKLPLPSFELDQFTKCDKNNNNYTYAKYQNREYGPYGPYKYIELVVAVTISKIGSYPISEIIEE